MIMISGICPERVPADAFFSCSQNSSITGMDNIHNELSVCRTETFSQREVLNSLRLSKRESRRNQVGATAVLHSSGTDILPYIFQSNQRDEDICYETLCSLAILTYIHNQDGEKA